MVTLTHTIRSAPTGGRILEITIAGGVAPGSDGNAEFARLEAEVDSLFRTHKPAAVMLDLTGLDYAGGDGMVKVAYPADSVPVAIAATGGTAIALRSLIPLSYPDLPIVHSAARAVSWIESTLAGASDRP